MSDIDWPARVRLTSALDQAAIVAITDRTGRIVYCNQKFVDVSGYAAEELLGKTHRVVNSGHHPAEFFAGLYQAISAGRSWRGTICNRNRDGGTYWVDTTIIPTMGLDGRPEFYTAIRFEVTAHVQALKDLEVAKARIEQAVEVRDLFYANISHEVRTPMNAVLGLTSALAQTELTPRQGEMLDVIQGASLALSRQLDDMLDLSKMRAGQLHLASAPFDLRATLADAVQPFKAAAQAKGVGFDLELDPEVEGQVLGDSDRLGQVIANLVSNAVKFTEAGSVSVTAGLSATQAVGVGPVLSVTVRDTGVGFDPVFAASLFEPFVQAQDGISRRFGGAGLGLPISKRLVEMMGGQIDAEAVAGEGSLFRITLPLERAPASERAPGDGQSEPVEAPGLRVLVVEDNLPNQMVVRCMLEPMGVEIAMANDGREGVEIYSTELFDAVLMDMQMPVMDGIAATRAIRALEAAEGRARTPIIMLTANTTLAHHRLAQGAGCDGIVVKPITLKSLLDGLAAGVTQSQATMALGS